MATRPNIVITQREGYSRGCESLMNVLQKTRQPFDLIYVDGGSPPAHRDELRRLSVEHGFRLIREERPLSPNEAKERALPYIRGTHAAFLDNDILVEAGWLEALLACADETGAGVVAPLYLERLGERERLHMFGGRCRIVEAGGRRVLDVTHESRKGAARRDLTRTRTEHVEMHGFLVRTDLLRAFTLFDPAIPTIPENADFCLTVSGAGESLWIEPRACLTVLLPGSVPEMDREFYRLRWSDAWIEHGFGRFREKWGLTGHQPVLESQRRWAIAHRVASHEDSLHQRLGVPSDSVLNRRLLAPIERTFRGW